MCGIMAFLPSDPVQTMLASQAVGQHLLVLDTFREIQVRSLSENGSLRSVSVTRSNGPMPYMGEDP